MTRSSQFAPACAATIAIAGAATAAIDSSYSERFEGLDAGSATALGDAGWLVGANVFEPNDDFAYNYFAFPAPNGDLDGAGFRFSRIAQGESGPNQGANALGVFSDYNNADHRNGTNRRIEANVFREYTVGANDAGTWTFSFDAKQGDIGGATTAVAFIKVLDSSFNLTDFATLDTTAIGTEWQEGLSISVDIEANQVGQIFQIGFWSIAGGDDPSTVFYDNLSLVPAPGAAVLLAVAGGLASRRRRA